MNTSSVKLIQKSYVQVSTKAFSPDASFHLQDKKLQRATYLKLEEEARLHKERLESDKNEVHELMLQVKERTSKLEIDKERVQLEQQIRDQDVSKASCLLARTLIRGSKFETSLTTNLNLNKLLLSVLDDMRKPCKSRNRRKTHTQSFP